MLLTLFWPDSNRCFILKIKHQFSQCQYHMGVTVALIVLSIPQEHHMITDWNILYDIMNNITNLLHDSARPTMASSFRFQHPETLTVSRFWHLRANNLNCSDSSQKQLDKSNSRSSGQFEANVSTVRYVSVEHPFKLILSNIWLS